MFLYGYAEMIIFAATGLAAPRFHGVMSKPIPPEEPRVSDYVHFDDAIDGVRPSNLRLRVPCTVHKNDAQGAQESLMLFYRIKAILKPAWSRDRIIVENADIFGLKFIAEQEPGPNAPIMVC
jgi:hypothetical protein